MIKWRCTICGYVYVAEIGDPESGVEPGIRFEELTEKWGCPDCGAAKELFEPFEDYSE
jgi:rubredoxin